MIKALIVLALVLLLVPAVAGHTEPPDKGAWTIEDDTIIENRTITLSGNLRINSTGNLTLINTTVYFNSPLDEPLGVIVNEGGRLTATDVDGDPDTGYDRTVFSASVESSRMRFYAKSGSTVVLRGVRLDHVGTRVTGASNPNSYLGVYCDGADIDISDVHLTHTYWGLILNGTESATIDGLRGNDLDFSLLQVFDSGDIDVWNVSTTDGSGEPAVIITDCNGTVRLHSPDIISFGECIKIVSSGDVWVYNATLESNSTLFWVERSRANIVNLAPQSSEMTVLVDSWVNVSFMVQIEVVTDPEYRDPVEGAVVNLTSCDPQNYNCDRGSAVTGADGLTPLISVPVAYFNESSTVHEAEHIITISTDEWDYESEFRPDEPGIVSFLEGEGVPYGLIPINGPIINGLVRRPNNLTVSVTDLIGQPALGGTVLFIITSPSDHGVSFSRDKPVLSINVPVLNGFATASVYTEDEVEDEEIRVYTKIYGTAFSLTTILLYPDLDFDSRIDTGARTTFDASASEGVGMTYMIDFGDGTDSGWTEDPTIEHEYSRPGTYVVRLIVRNEDGLMQSVTGEVTVTDEVDEPPDLLTIVGGSVLVLGILVIAAAAYGYHRRKMFPTKRKEVVGVRTADKTRMAIKWYDRGTMMASANPEEAISCLEKSLQLNPTLSRAHYNLGLLLISKGDRAGAREMFVHALSNDPGLTDAQRALDALERTRRVIVKKQ